MTAEQFQSLAELGYNRIPVTREILADFDTPLSVYLKLADCDYTCLLESVEGGDKWGRYSFIGLGSRTVLKIFGHTLMVEQDGELVEHREVADPLAEVEQFMAQFRAPELPELPRFHGGLVGYFGYDTVRYIEPRLAHSQPTDLLGTPDILLMVIDNLVVFDNLSGKVTLITHIDPTLSDTLSEALANAEAEIDSHIHRLKNKQAELPSRPAASNTPAEQAAHSLYGQQAFQNSVEKIKEYILAGDVMQVVPSQRMTLPYDDHPLNLYRTLRSLNPSPYMYYLNLRDFHVVGSSPEILARLENGNVTVRPIAGTRKRGRTEAEDLAMEQELIADPKEIAEHLMLIDLGRNDISRIAETGSVTLTDKMAVERYSHVMHMVSNVTCRLRQGLTAMDVLKATLPAGTLSGAPKVRAMEIIDEQEPVKRGIYGGAVGYLSWNGNMDTAIAIRTAVIKDNQLNVQAGAGVVTDSVAELEWKETLNKGRAIFSAVDQVFKGL